MRIFGRPKKKKKRIKNILNPWAPPKNNSRKSSISDLRPFFCITIIIATLFVIVFLKMEKRRMGYVLLKKSRELKVLEDQQRLQNIRWAQATRSERLRRLAKKKLTLDEPKKGQLIQISGDRMALRL